MPWLARKCRRDRDRVSHGVAWAAPVGRSINPRRGTRSSSGAPGRASPGRMRLGGRVRPRRCEVGPLLRRGTRRPRRAWASLGLRAEGEPPGAGGPARPDRRRPRARAAPAKASAWLDDELVVHQQQRLGGDGRARAALAVGRHRAGASNALEQAQRQRLAADLDVEAAAELLRRRATPACPTGVPAASRVSSPTTTWPASSGETGTGGPNIRRLSRPLTARIASRTASASSRRTGIRPSSRLSGSIASSAGVAPRRLAVGRRGHDQPVQPLQRPAAAHEVVGQPVEQLGVGRPLAERAEVARRRRRSPGRSGASRRG